MKKIFTSVAVLAACGLGAFAQKNVDLGFTITNPTEMGQYANVAQSDSFNFKINITNSGTAAVVANDTMQLWAAGYSVNTTQGQLAWTGRIITGLSIPAGQSTEYSFWVVKGSGFITGNNDTIINHFWDNDTNSVIFEGYGWDANGNLFNDPGVDNSNPDGDGALTGNNTTGTRRYILGNPTSLNNVFSAKVEALNVYPNPTTGAVNLNYTFKSAVDAAIRVTDIAGRVVYTQNLGKQAAGKQAFKFNLGNLANGMYTIELSAGENRATSQFNINK